MRTINVYCNTDLLYLFDSVLTFRTAICSVNNEIINRVNYHTSGTFMRYNRDEADLCRPHNRTTIAL